MDGMLRAKAFYADHSCDEVYIANGPEHIMPRAKKTVAELEAIGLQRVRARPGCRGVSSITLVLDEDGEWSFGTYDAGSVSPEIVQHAAIVAGHAMHDEFDLAADT